MKKLKVNTEGCIGCGFCVATDPEHFTFNELGYSIVKMQDDVNEEKIKQIITGCPTEVISYEECPCNNCDCKEKEAA